MSIVISDLVKIYGKQKAVDNVSFKIEKGEVVGFLGPNGAGKSTTMKITTGYVPASAGQVTVAGHNALEESLAVRKKTGYLPEHNPLYLDMYVHEYLRFIAGIHQLTKKNEKAKHVIHLCGLEKEQNKKIGALSKGYRQRIGLAQALIHDPEILILDEPTTGLDPNQILEIRKLIKTVSKDKTVIFSTHIMQEVEAMCNRVLIINQGKLIADSTVDELKKGQADGKRLIVSFESPVPLEKLSSCTGVNSVKEIASGKYAITFSDPKTKSSLLALAASESWALESLKEEESSLEQVFHELTKANTTV